MEDQGKAVVGQGKAAAGQGKAAKGQRQCSGRTCARPSTTRAATTGARPGAQASGVAACMDAARPREAARKGRLSLF